MGTNPQQSDLLEIDDARTLLDQLLADSRLYTQTKDYKDLLDFVVRLRNFAPFNAMLLQIQKPGLSYATMRMNTLDGKSQKNKGAADVYTHLVRYGM